MKNLLLLSCILCSSLSYSQKAGNIWYFGSFAGLDFNTNPPTPLNNGVLNTSEGCSSYSDPSTGQILLYTDGITVWNKNHTPMPGSVTTPLNGDPSSTQSGVIVPKPGSSTIIYIFSTAATAGNFGISASMCYSIVDLSLNGGLGDLTTVNNVLIDSSTEKIAAVGNCNGSSFWIVGHRWNTDSFYAYKLSSAGLSPVVKSKAGIVHQNTNTTGTGINAETLGYMKFSSDAKKLGLVVWAFLNTMQIFDFDVNTGVISNPITDVFPPATAGSYDAPYGCSFSPDNSKFYVAYLGGPSVIYQYDMNAGNTAAILASRNIIATGTSFGALQNGPNGKMYVATTGSTSLDVINDPNNYGAACNYTVASQSLNGASVVYGLPAIVESFLSGGSMPLFTHPANNSICAGDTVFAPQPIKSTFSIQPTGTYTISADSSMVNFYPTTTTTYTIVNTGDCGSNDTSYLTISIVPFPTPDFTFNPLNPDLSNTSITLQNQSIGASSYEWLDNLIIKSTNTDYTIPNPGLGKHCYTLNAYNALGCVKSITKCVEVGDTIVSTFFVPSAFSPNGDGVNDILKVLGTNIQLNLFSIYNRFGNILFTTDDITKGWDGSYQGTVCDNGVYFYMVQYVDSKNKTRVLGGDVTLIH